MCIDEVCQIPREKNELYAANENIELSNTPLGLPNEPLLPASNQQIEHKVIFHFTSRNSKEHADERGDIERQYEANFDLSFFIIHADEIHNLWQSAGKQRHLNFVQGRRQISC